MPAHKAVKHDEWLILLHRTSRRREPPNRPDLKGYERLPRATGWEKCALTTREK